MAHHEPNGTTHMDPNPDLYIKALKSDAARNRVSELLDETEPFNDCRIFAVGVPKLDHLKAVMGAMGLSDAWMISHIIGDLDFNPWGYGVHDSGKLVMGFIQGDFLDRDFAATIRREARMSGMASHVATSLFGENKDHLDLDALFSDAVTGALNDAFDGRMRDDPRAGG